jgi:hypothetical protein
MDSKNIPGRLLILQIAGQKYSLSAKTAGMDSGADRQT